MTNLRGPDVVPILSSHAMLAVDAPLEVGVGRAKSEPCTKVLDEQVVISISGRRAPDSVSSPGLCLRTSGR